MNSRGYHPTARAFSLIEVVLAIGLIGIAIPSLVGISSYFIKNSKDLQTYQETSNLLDLLSDFLSRQYSYQIIPNPKKIQDRNAPSSFNFSSLSTLYLYRTPQNPETFQVSIDFPKENEILGDLFRAEISPLNPSPSVTPRLSLPIEITLFRSSRSKNIQKGEGSKLGSYPMILTP